MEQQTLIFLGTQGAGKGTQIDLLKTYLGGHDSRPIVHVEMGKSLRALAERDNYTGRTVQSSLARGELTPFAISTTVFTEYLIEHMQTGDEHLLVDGFPRTLDQTPNIESVAAFYNRANPTVLYLTVPDEVAIERLRKRGRSDDTEEGIRERLRWSAEEAAPVHDWFKQHARFRFFEIDATPGIEDIHQNILRTLAL